MKILVLGKLLGKESSYSIKNAREVYNSLLEMKYDVILNYIRGIRDLERIIESCEFNKIFLLTYGDWGNNGQIQSFLDSYDIDYTFSGSEVSGIFYDKIKTKEYLDSLKIQVPKTLTRPSYPCILKHVENGGSVGVFLLKNRLDLKAYKTDNENWFYEEYLSPEDWNEYTISIHNDVIGNPIWIKKNGEIWYKNDGSEEILDYDEKDKIRDFIEPVLVKINKNLKIKDGVRVDFCIDKDLNNYRIIEINGMPILNKGGYFFRSLEDYNKDLTYEKVLENFINS